MKRRSLIKVFLFSVVTLGIYNIYWLYATRREMRALGAEQTWPVLVLFAPFIVLIGAFLVYALATFLSPFDPAINPQPVIQALNILLFCIGAAALLAQLILPFIWFLRFSKDAEFVTKSNIGARLSFLVWLLSCLFCLPFIWQMILQDYFNQARTAPNPQLGNVNPDAAF